MTALSSATISRPLVKGDGEVLVELKDVNVSYHERKVSVLHLTFFIAGQYPSGVAKHELDDSRERKMAPPGIKRYFFKGFTQL